MDWPVVGPMIAAVAALIAAITQIVRMTGDHAWYRRWLEVLEHAETDAERAIARERIDHYVGEFSITDRTRKKRRDAFAFAALLVVFSVMLWTGSLIVFNVGASGGGWPFIAIGWVVVAFAVVSYLLGLYLIVFFPDRERSQAREELDRIVASVPRATRRRWWQAKLPHA